MQAAKRLLHDVLGRALIGEHPRCARDEPSMVFRPNFDERLVGRDGERVVVLHGTVLRDGVDIISTTQAREM
jgi:hypothetical protein